MGYLDGYCERVGPGLWGEPLNTVSNLAFLAAAVALWVAGRGAPWRARVLAPLVGLIFLGSTALHALATPWSAAADSGSIAVFLLYHVVLAARQGWSVPWRFAWLAAAAFVLLALLTSGAMRAAGAPLSGMYLAALLVVAGLAVAWRRTPYGRDVAVAAVVFAVSLTLRTLDGPLCPSWPSGTHFAWHLCNALALFLASRAALRMARSRP